MTIVIMYMGGYSAHTTPIYSLFESDRSTLLYEITKDRQLISTLVAGQASILCPLFLLYFQNLHSEEEEQQHQQQQPSLLELACQFVMPLGLALSWVFCLIFDWKTMQITLTHWTSVVLHILKYVVVAFLLLELALGLVSVLQLGTTVGAIHLDEEEREEGTRVERNYQAIKQ
ncbi:hypothetical protein EC973_005366 [Apophysomyces ossiformis]|uniref:Uncharacterized protein n=1 Tax=Apophysomyces ossiformis TaxID=679940 RepID=A0A8H7BE05_9FUNG|nr:hypothetical protein EC973_005366 [Apophysomyces ossiformis]